MASAAKKPSKGRSRGRRNRARRAVTEPVPSTEAIVSSSEDDTEDADIESSDTDTDGGVSLALHPAPVAEVNTSNANASNGNASTANTSVNTNGTSPLKKIIEVSDAESSDTDTGGASLLDHPDPSDAILDYGTVHINRAAARPSILPTDDSEDSEYPEAQDAIVDYGTMRVKRSPARRSILPIEDSDDYSDDEHEDIEKTPIAKKVQLADIASGSPQAPSAARQPSEILSKINYPTDETSALNLDGVDERRSGLGSSSRIVVNLPNLPPRPPTANSNNSRGQGKGRHRGWNPPPPKNDVRQSPMPNISPLNVPRQREQRLPPSLHRETAAEGTLDAHGRPINGETILRFKMSPVKSNTKSNLNAQAKPFNAAAPQNGKSAQVGYAESTASTATTASSLHGSFSSGDLIKTPAQLKSPAGAPPMLAPTTQHRTHVSTGSPSLLVADEAPKTPRSAERTAVLSPLKDAVSRGVARRNKIKAEEEKAITQSLINNIETQNMRDAMHKTPEMQRLAVESNNHLQEIHALQNQLAGLSPSHSAGSVVKTPTLAPQTPTIQFASGYGRDGVKVLTTQGTWDGIAVKPGCVLTTHGNIPIIEGFTPRTGDCIRADHVTPSAPQTPTPGPASTTVASPAMSIQSPIGYTYGLMPTHAMMSPPTFNLNVAGAPRLPPSTALVIANGQYSPDPFSASPDRQALQLHQQQQQLTLYKPSMLTPVSPELRAVRSMELNRLVPESGLPNLEAVLSDEFFPFCDATSLHPKPVLRGVVKLKNIPFNAKRGEIIAFLGKNSKILNDNEEPVHVIMERVTSKTQDAYVEFVSPQDALVAVERFTRQLIRGKAARLDSRPIDVELSCQAALMQDLFPLAKGIKWDGCTPIKLQEEPGQIINKFKGFICEEEMTMIVKNAENPAQTPFAGEKCPQRPFESMISTLKKLPWNCTGMITIKQRWAIFDATMKLIQLLQNFLRTKKHADVCDKRLLKRLVHAAMLCAGFTVVMKDSIAWQVGLTSDEIMEFNMPRFADQWLHTWSLAPKPNKPLDLLEWYIAIIREETTRAVNQRSIVDRTGIIELGKETDLYWGYFWHETGFSRIIGREFDNMTLLEAYHREMAVLEDIFVRLFKDPAVVEAQQAQKAQTKLLEYSSPQMQPGSPSG